MMLTGGASGDGYLMRAAHGSSELQAVYRFRYEHFFHIMGNGYPGLDHPRCRVFEPHDAGSVHYCAFDMEGALCAVSTAVPADAPDIPSVWQDWFQLARLPKFGFGGIVVSTRMVIHPAYRHKGLFELFYNYIIERYFEEGYDCAVHFCSPGLICRYERLGHRVYADPFMIPTGLLRAPMLIALYDFNHLLRVGSPITRLSAARATLTGAHEQFFQSDPASALNFRLLTPQQRLSYVAERIGTERLPNSADVLPVLEHGSHLRLKAGLSHTAPPGGGFLSLVLSGTIKEEGHNVAAGPGDFVGVEILLDPNKSSPPFSVTRDAEVLVFNQNLTREATKSFRDSADRSPWSCLRLASRELSFVCNPLLVTEESKSCGMPL